MRARSRGPTRAIGGAGGRSPTRRRLRSSAPDPSVMATTIHKPAFMRDILVRLQGLLPGLVEEAITSPSVREPRTAANSNAGQKPRARLRPRGRRGPEPNPSPTPEQHQLQRMERQIEKLQCVLDENVNLQAQLADAQTGIRPQRRAQQRSPSRF